MSNKKIFNRKVFWKDLGKEYLDLTHLHGFKELSVSETLTERIFWILIILGAFAFTGFLIHKSVDDALHDKKQTFVKYDKYGNISLPVLYCPSRWINMDKVIEANISRYLFYAMSFFRTSRATYMDESVLDKGISSELFCGNNSTPIDDYQRELIIFIPFIENSCLKNSTIPDFFGQDSRKLLKYFLYITRLMDMSLYILRHLFDACMNDNYEEMWRIFYNDTYLSYTAEEPLKGMFDDQKISQKISRCGGSSKLTLNDVDNLRNENFDCRKSTAIKKKIDLNSAQNGMCRMYNDLFMYYMFHSEAIQSYTCPTCNEHIKFEADKSKEIAMILSTDKRYSKFMHGNNYINSFETFKKFINIEIGGTDQNQNVELETFRMRTTEEFEMKEKDNFERYLKERNKTVFDILKIASFDENKFLLGMSVDPVFQIWPRSGTINVHKVFNGFGICYLFNIQANMRPVTKLPFVINDISKRGRINQKLFVNIAELAIGNGLLVRNYNENFIAFGSTSMDLIPGQNMFNVKTLDNWEDYHSFEISNLAYQSELGVTECQEKVKNEYDITHSFGNCLANCFNIHSQPKYIEGKLSKTANCEYIGESMSGTNVKVPCSFFSGIGNSSLMVQNDTDTLQKNLDFCNSNCVQDCELIKFDIKSTEISGCFEKGLCTFYLRRIQKNYKKSTLVTYYENLPSNGSKSKPIWMKPFQGVNEYSVEDLLTTGIIEVINRSAIARIKIQINSDVTIYETTLSLTWFTWLGVVGGQINLVVSGSILTLFQLIWWFSRHCYANCRSPSPATIRNQEIISSPV